MSWSLGTFDVREAYLADETALKDGRLSVDADELRAMLLADASFADVRIDIVRPGDDVRIVHVVDVVEPRLRVSEPGTDYPGLLGPQRTVGLGRTHRLRGVTVMVAAPPLPMESVLHREAVVDMSGEGSRYSPFGSLLNLVVTFEPDPERFSLTAPAAGTNVNVTSANPEAVAYNRAIRLGALRAANYLAELTRDAEPDTVTEYDLDGDEHPDLPGVVYLCQIAQAYVYGVQVIGGGPTPHLPTLVRPTEVLDGALVNASIALSSMADLTYVLQNHAVIEELCLRHGADLAFKGVVLFQNGDSVQDKERVSNHAANLAVILGASGAIVTYGGGGHPTVDTMMTCAALEKRGVRTTVMVGEMATDPEDFPLPHFVPEADAIVSTGNYEMTLDLEPVATVLGGTTILGSGEDAAGGLTVPLRRILASTHKSGLNTLRARTY